MIRPIMKTATAIAMLMAGTVIASAQSTDADKALPPAAGETSDRTPGTKTETPLSQRDKTTAEPSGSTASPPKDGTTSDRTPGDSAQDRVEPGSSASGPSASGTKGKTTSSEDMKTNKY